jgi:hypothetical protein
MWHVFKAEDGHSHYILVFPLLLSEGHFREILWPFSTSMFISTAFGTSGRYNGACRIWRFRCGDYEECHLLGYKTPVRTSQETHYVSATQSSQLMLCKIWSFHGSDYEECCLLGYKTPVRTSQETHYISTTELSQLMLRKIGGFHGGVYEACRLLACYAMWLL